MKKEIFREYDLRGIYPTELNDNDAYLIGKAFASYIKDKNVIIGHDNRLSSESLNDNLIKGLISAGANILDLGLCTTPMYYANKKALKYQNGIMITASHNPKDYNGFKISFNEIGNAYGKEIYDFRDFVFAGDFEDRQGTYQKYSETENYYLKLTKLCNDPFSRRLKVAYDPGNGTAGIILRKVLEMFDIDFAIINEKSDGNFPNHHPDPCEEKNMIELGYFVKENHYDFGIGIDGDADRLGVVDNNGKLVDIDKLMILFYQYLKPVLNPPVAYMDVKCSKALLDMAKEINLQPLVSRTGASIANYEINTKNLMFGGEFSGHIWFTDKWPGFDDGIYASLRLIEMMSKTNASISELIDKLPKYYNTPEIKIPVDDNKKSKVIEKLKEYLNNKNIKYNDIDGIRIDLDDGFILIRQSNTTPNLTVRFEKGSEEELEKIKIEYLEIIKKITSDNF